MTVNKSFGMFLRTFIPQMLLRVGTSVYEMQSSINTNLNCKYLLGKRVTNFGTSVQTSIRAYL